MEHLFSLSFHTQKYGSLTTLSKLLRVFTQFKISPDKTVIQQILNGNLSYGMSKTILEITLTFIYNTVSFIKFVHRKKEQKKNTTMLIINSLGYFCVAFIQHLVHKCLDASIKENCEKTFPFKNWTVYLYWVSSKQRHYQTRISSDCLLLYLCMFAAKQYEGYVVAPCWP